MTNVAKKQPTSLIKKFIYFIIFVAICAIIGYFIFNHYEHWVKKNSPYNKITSDKLEEVLYDHKLWLDTDGKQGKKADLSFTSFKNHNLSNLDLRYAKLNNSNFSGLSINNTDFRYADIKESLWQEVNLTCVDLRYAELQDSFFGNLDKDGTTKFWDANLEGASVYQIDPEIRELRQINQPTKKSNDSETKCFIKKEKPSVFDYIWEVAKDVLFVTFLFFVLFVVVLLAIL